VSPHNYDHTASTSANRQCVDRDHGDDETTQFVMTSETLRAVDAVKFIATHLRTEDDYAEVSDGNEAEYFRPRPNLTKKKKKKKQNLINILHH